MKSIHVTDGNRLSTLRLCVIAACCVMTPLLYGFALLLWLVSGYGSTLFWLAPLLPLPIAAVAALHLPRRAPRRPNQFSAISAAVKRQVDADVKFCEEICNRKNREPDITRNENGGGIGLIDSGPIDSWHGQGQRRAQR